MGTALWNSEAHCHQCTSLVPVVCSCSRKWLSHVLHNISEGNPLILEIPLHYSVMIIIPVSRKSSAWTNFIAKITHNCEKFEFLYLFTLSLCLCACGSKIRKVHEESRFCGLLLKFVWLFLSQKPIAKILWKSAYMLMRNFLTNKKTK